MSARLRGADEHRRWLRLQRILWRTRFDMSAEAGHDVAAEIVAWRQVEIGAVRVVTSGLGLVLPLVIAVAMGRLDIGMAAGIGALLASGSGHDGGLRQRIVDVVATIVTGSAAFALGMATSSSTVGSAVVIVAVAVVAGLLGGVRASFAKVAAQVTVFVILGVSLAILGLPTVESSGFFVLGGIGAGCLTLSGYALRGHFLREPDSHRSVSWGYGLGGHVVRDSDAARRRSEALRADLRRWVAGLRGIVGWRYAIRLGTCMATAEIIAHLWPAEHSTWLALTVALVVQRDTGLAVQRTIERGLGTLLGVALSWFLLGALPLWATLVAVGVIGALRPYVKLANYTVYAMVMTPLVVLLTGLGTQPSVELLRERLVFTVIGCAVSLIVGSGVGRLLR